MFDRIRLFRVLLSLTRESDYFILAQDAYVVLHSILEQLANLDTIIDEFYEKIDTLIEEAAKDVEIEAYKSAVCSLQMLMMERESWCNMLQPFLCDCEEFWFCSPVDRVTGKYNAISLRSLQSSEKRWHKYHNLREEIPTAIILKLQRFRSRVTDLVQEHFSELLSATLVEEEAERSARSQLSRLSCKYANIISCGITEEFDATNNSVTVVCNFPVTHFFVADHKFAKLLGYSTTRLLAIPFVNFIINTGTTTSVVRNIVELQSPTHVTLFYRTATCSVVVVSWEICPKPIGSHAVVARGINITRELEESKQYQTANIQKMLRQWLHSIRNASFQQQAQVIRDDIQALEKSIDDDEFSKGFQHVYDGLRTLIYTAKASVGLIDQALNSKGLLQYTSLHDFVNSIATFSSVFSKSEGIDDILNTFDLHFNDNVTTPEQLRSIYVQGDMCSLQSLIDNIYSNAIKFTDHTLGVNVVMHIEHQGDSVHCTLQITDNSPLGLPQNVIRYFQKHISPCKVDDQRSRRFGSSVTSTDSDDACMDFDYKELPDDWHGGWTNPSPPVSRGVSRSNSRKASMSAQYGSRSTVVDTKDGSIHTGIPHIVELFHKLTESAEYNFDMVVTARANGSSYTLSFSLGVLSAAELALDVEDDYPENNTALQNIRPMEGKESIQGMDGTEFLSAERDHLLKPTEEQYMLVVDDSHVIRRIVGRYLEKYEVRYHACADGTEAFEWFKEHSDICFGLITDLEMPRMGGDALIQEVKALRPTLPCVIVSGNEIPIGSRPSGAAACFIKPISMTSMNDLLHELYRCAAALRREA
mmetsp:Transcript_3726/g.5773  ORF Transcript_3726/g.5773 Transcript_3726/m.5773 type:complete len:814 (+) Transcript_3726:85-2526(+)